MTKKEFLDNLRLKLNGIPKEDLDERISFYDEAIDDRIEEGLKETEAVDELGSIDDIYKQIVSDIPISKLVKDKVLPNRSLKVWEIFLIIISSPIWASLLIALISVIVSLYLVLCSLILAIWATVLSVLISGIAGIIGFIILLIQGKLVSGFVILGLGLILCGLSFAGYVGCKFSTNAIIKLTKKSFIFIKSCLMKKELS